jgi:predicted transcriptional regulator
MMEIGQVVKYRRSSTDICIEVLGLCKNPIKPTHIMQRVNIAYPLVKKYCSHLLKLGLINAIVPRLSYSGVEDRRSTVEYTATEKGLNILRTAELLELRNLRNNSD